MYKRQQVYTDFRTRYSAVESWVFLNDIPRGTAVTGMYRFDDSPDCGPGTSSLRGSGTLVASPAPTPTDTWLDLRVPVVTPGAGPSSAMVYTLTLTADGQTRTIEDHSCFSSG